MMTTPTETTQPIEQNSQKAGCCGGPAPEGSSACCIKDAEAKAKGQSGCGCGCSKK